jgi:hypothetical protein
MSRCRFNLLLGPLACLGAASCSSDPSRGYSFNSTYSTAIHSVAVPVFDNRDFQYGLELQLTDAIIKEIQHTTPWVVVQGQNGGGADTTLTGVITATTLQNLTTSSTTGLVQEMAFQITVDFDWRDARSGKYLVSRRDFHAMESFVPAPGSRERLEIGEHAAVQEMARNIVRELRSNW